MRKGDNRAKWIERVLGTLIEWDEPLRKSDIAILMDEEQNHAYLIGLIDGLWFGGYVHLYKSDDQRVTWVTISDEGRAWYDNQQSIPF